MGGFGWAVKQVSRCFADDPTLGVDVVILMAESPQSEFAAHKLHGSPVVYVSDDPKAQTERLKAIDLLLSIDFRRSYRSFIEQLPSVPLIIWARDPWDRDDHREVASLKIPGKENEKPQAMLSKTTQLAVQGWMKPPLFASTADFIAKKIPDAYGVRPKAVHFLPNIIKPMEGIKKSDTPTIVWLARLDPIKRPWILMDLAQHFPRVEFLIIGQAHFSGPGSWSPENVPPNVRLLGHVDGPRKKKLLASAWLLINTSIHEGLSVSFLEALACEVPIIACVDPEQIVSRYGIFVGKYSGAGLTSVAAFSRAVSELLSNSNRRCELGASGRAWVRRTHSRARFLAGFFRLTTLTGLNVPKN